jgi:hypothetical protein
MAVILSSPLILPLLIFMKMKRGKLFPNVKHLVISAIESQIIDVNRYQVEKKSG